VNARFGLVAAALVAAVLSGATCSVAPARCGLEASEDFPECPAGVVGLTAAQKARADSLVSVFENDTIALQYAYIEDIGDGRGYTAGRAGFTTATGDFVVVVERYTALAPGNALAPYLPRLRELATAESDATTGLEGVVAAWLEAADDPVFRGVQDAVSDELYYDRAVCWWRSLGLERALSLVLLYDTNIQHGEGTDADSLPGIIERTNARLGGPPASGVDEAAWLRGFLDERQASLAHACDPGTRREWAEAVPRVLALRRLIDDENWQFAGPIAFEQEPYTAVVIP
jgi:chitosanase